MKVNRSIPKSTIIPEIAYANLGEAADWLQDAFGFQVRLWIGNHRVQMMSGDGAVVLVDRPEVGRSSLMVRVENVDLHCMRAARWGASILRPPETFPFGERQYRVEDPGGNYWTFTQTVADVDPEVWGGKPGPAFPGGETPA